MALSISQTLQLQQELYGPHTWPPMEPEFGKDSITYMVEEIGEVVSVLKKYDMCRDYVTEYKEKYNG